MSFVPLVILYLTSNELPAFIILDTLVIDIDCSEYGSGTYIGSEYTITSFWP